MAMDTSGFVPKGNLNADEDALVKSGRSDTVRRVLSFLVTQTSAFPERGKPIFIVKSI